VVQFAKTFQMPRNDAVNAASFHRLFHRNCVNYFQRSGDVT
jgi:hypothetical protein